MHSVSSNAVAELLSYTLGEVKTGMLWTDGKPIYKNTIDLGAYNSGWIYPDHNIANIDTIVYYFGMAYKNDTNKTSKIFPNYDSYISMNRLAFAITDINSTFDKIIVTSFYTKTTD